MSLLQSLSGLRVSRPSAQILGYASTAWNWTRYRLAWWTRRRVVLEPYRRPLGPRSLALGGFGIAFLGLFCLAYGFFFGLTAPYLLAPFIAPVGVLAMIVVWALPDLRRAPTYGIELLFPATLVVLLLWPDYVAISLPGMPWITILRLVSFSLAGVLLVCLSVSPSLRAELGRIMRATPLMWTLLAAFVTNQIVTIGISQHPLMSLQAVVLFQVSCTATFVIGAVLFRQGKYVERYFGLLCAIGVILAILAFYEQSRQHVIWAGHIPSFLRIPDPAVQRMLLPSFRQWIDVYRVKATFKTPLVLAEYISLLTPILMYFALSRRSTWVRVAAALLIPFNFVLIRATDSRLGIVGMLVSLLLFGLLWSIIRWRSRPRDLFAAAVIYAYPTLFCAALALIFASHRLHDMVFGGGAQASSTEARNAQLAMALPKVWTHPFGFGANQCGINMGFASVDLITIDNYFIALILDFGFLGVLFWYGLFVTGIFAAVRYSVSREYSHRPEAGWLAVLAVSLTGFLIVKWVHAATDNHTIYFMLLGMIAALVYRLKSSSEAATERASVFGQVGP